MTTLTMRLIKGHFVVIGPDVQPVKFKSRREARDWCKTHHPGSPTIQKGACRNASNGKPTETIPQTGCVARGHRKSPAREDGAKFGGVSNGACHRSRRPKASAANPQLNAADASSVARRARVKKPRQQESGADLPFRGGLPLRQRQTHRDNTTAGRTARGHNKQKPRRGEAKSADLNRACRSGGEPTARHRSRCTQRTATEKAPQRRGASGAKSHEGRRKRTTHTETIPVCTSPPTVPPPLAHPRTREA